MGIERLHAGLSRAEAGASALGIPSKCCYFIDKAGSSLRRSRLKIILLYLRPQFSVYTEFGIDPPTGLRNPEPRSLFWLGTYDCAFPFKQAVLKLGTMRWLGHLPAHSCGFHFSTFRQNKPFRGINTILSHIL